MHNNQFIQIETIISDFANEIKVSSQKRCIVMGEFLRTHTFIFDLFNTQTRQFMELRYGIKDGNYWTLDAIGSLMGCTRERVRQIEKEMLIELSKPYRLKLLREYDDTTFDKSMLSDFKSLLSQDIINKISDEVLVFLEDIPVCTLKFKSYGSNGFDSIEQLKVKLSNKRISTCKDLILYLQQHDFIEDLDLSMLSYKCLVYSICELVYGKNGKDKSKEVLARQKEVKLEREKLKKADQKIRIAHEQLEKQHRLSSSNKNPEKIMIEDLGFEKIIYHALKHEGINTIGDLIKYCGIGRNIRSIRLFGEQKEGIVLQKLESIGVDFYKRVKEYRDELCKSPDTMTIEFLNLNTRVYNVLKRSGINTVGQLVDFYKEHKNTFKSINRLGDEGEDEILNKLAELNIKLPSSIEVCRV